jgi:hypothetical protein
MKGRGVYFGTGAILVLELLVVICVILVSVTYIASNYQPIKKGVFVRAVSLESISLWKDSMNTYHAINGNWPENKDDLKYFIHENLIDWKEVKSRLKEYYDEEELMLIEDPEISSYIRNNEIGYQIINGAIDISIKSNSYDLDLNGETLTVRPAVPIGNPTGPVRWITGKNDDIPGWQVIGQDHTTLYDNGILPHILNQ